ncbi:MAG: archaeosortase A [Methanoculleaceae archaeon]
MGGIFSLIGTVAIGSSIASFIASLIPTRFREYPAIAGWTCLSIYLLSEVPYYFEEQNFFYPAAAVLSIPFVYITSVALLRKEEAVLLLSRIAAVASLIYAPFGYIQPVGEWLISVVAAQTGYLLHLLSYPVDMVAWNIIARNGYQTEIVLACTGIQSIAIMTAVSLAVPGRWKEKVSLSLVVASTIYILNLFRNAFVIMAYTGQWFSFLPDIGESQYPGYGSFFWAHNVLSESLALIVLIGLSYILFSSLPELGRMAEELFRLYRDGIRIRRTCSRGR